MRGEDVRVLGVVGSGLMGSGIVEVAARAGQRVVYLEASDELVESGRHRIETSMARAVERGKLDAKASDEIHARIAGTTDPNDLADVDLVIEAATEDADTKRAVFRRPSATAAAEPCDDPPGLLTLNWASAVSEYWGENRELTVSPPLGVSSMMSAASPSLGLASQRRIAWPRTRHPRASSAAAAAAPIPREAPVSSTTRFFIENRSAMRPSVSCPFCLRDRS